MKIFDGDNFIPLEEFTYTWRWTNPMGKWSLLPPDDLAQIKPFRKEQARLLWKQAIVILSPRKWALSPERFPAIQTFDDNRTDSPEEARQWLLSLDIPEQTPIVIAWHGPNAVLTHWGVFCRHWNCFLYPSDNVVIWPATEEQWALFYFHEEKFEFGKAV